MDAVYILGDGSLAGNEEIRYSLRALSTYMLDLRNVYVVGRCPEFLPHVRHLACDDPTPEKWKNAYLKTRKACEIAELSEEFLLMNDDFFMLQPFEGAEWPFYSLKGSNGGACGPRSYHVHMPIRVNKKMYASMPFDVESKACRSPRTFYANFYGAPAEPHDDPVLLPGDVWSERNMPLRKWPCFSVGDPVMLDDGFRLWLAKRYPEPSRFEG